MALMAAHGDLAPMPDAAIFADTGNEPGSVYRWLEWLVTELPFPVNRVSKRRKDQRLLTLAEASLEMHVTSDGRRFSQTNILDFSTAEEMGQLNFFENECEGMCGV
jgi:hypothetical protein